MTRTKRVMSVVAVLALALALAAPAWALGDIDLAAEASIELEMADSAFAQDLAGSAITVLVYKLASVDEHGTFAQEPDFATLGNGEMWSGVLSGNTDMAALADAAKALIFPADAEPDEGVDTEDPMYEPEPAIEPLLTVQADPEGASIVIQDAETSHGLGLYLLLARKAQTGRWVYTFNPVLVPVPAVVRDTTPDEGGLPSEGHWEYDVPAGLKAEREPRLMALEIEKYLQTYNRNLGPTTFVFDVVGRDAAGNVVYQSTEQLTFYDDSSASQRVRVENIPAGATVTVEEVYTGGSKTNQSYQSTDGTVRVVVMDPGTLPEGQDAHRVEFSNDYSGGRTPDAAVENVFTSDGEGHWSWHKVPDSEEAG